MSLVLIEIYAKGTFLVLFQDQEMGRRKWKIVRHVRTLPVSTNLRISNADCRGDPYIIYCFIQSAFSLGIWHLLS